MCIGMPVTTEDMTGSINWRMRPITKGAGNYWGFTKNATTGVMKIFLNGVQYGDRTNLDNVMLDIQRFSIGGATGWSNFYNGSVDEFAVFNVALEASTIQEWMLKDLTPDHPFWSQLQVYYQFNENDGEMVLDASGHDRHAWMHGNAALLHTRAMSFGEMRKRVMCVRQSDYPQGTILPMLKISQAVRMKCIPPVSVVQYSIENYQPVVASVEYAWEEQNSYILHGGWATPSMKVLVLCRIHAEQFRNGVLAGAI